MKRKEKRRRKRRREQGEEETPSRKAAWGKQLQRKQVQKKENEMHCEKDMRPKKAGAENEMQKDMRPTASR